MARYTHGRRPHLQNITNYEARPAARSHFSRELVLERPGGRKHRRKEPRLAMICQPVGEQPFWESRATTRVRGER